MPDRGEILKLVKVAIENKNIDFVPREKNRKTLAQLGITWRDAIDEIKSLEETNYFKGPMEDKDRKDGDSLWVFKKVVVGEIIYIKFKIDSTAKNQLKVIGFHIDE